MPWLWAWKTLRASSVFNAGLLLFSANIMMMGPQFRDYFAERREGSNTLRPLDVWLLAETHVLEEDAVDWQQSFFKDGCYSFWSPALRGVDLDVPLAPSAAQPSADNRKAKGKGGTAVIAEQAVETAPLELGHGENPGKTEFEDFTPISVQAGNLALIAVVLYLTPAGKKTLQLQLPSNRRKLVALAALLSMYTLPWVVAAHWNETPGVLSKDPWLQAVEGEICATGSPTCTQGQARELDYIICSRGFRKHFEIRLVTGVPWKPNVGIELAFREPTSPPEVWKLAAPMRPALPKITKKERDKKENANEEEETEANNKGHFDSWSWGRCRAFANAQPHTTPKQGAAIDIKGSFAYLLEPEGAEARGRDLARWWYAAEAFHATRSPAVNSHSELVKHVGRAKGPKFKWSTLGKKNGRATLARAVAAQSLQWWAILASNLQFASAIAGRKPERLDQHLRETGAMLTNQPHLEEELQADLAPRELWQMRLANLRGASLPDIQTWAEEAAHTQEKLRRATAAKSAKGFAQWIIDMAALVKHCRAIYRWTIEKQAPPPVAIKSQHVGLATTLQQKSGHHRASWNE